MINCGQTLESYMDARLTQTDKLKLFLSLVEKLDELHSMGFYHRDIKPANICVSADCEIQFIDFGLSCKYRFDDTVCGTEPFVAPEKWNQSSHDNLSADWFSCGVILFELMYGKFVVERYSATKNVYEALSKVDQNDIPDEIWQTIARLTSSNPKARWRKKHILRMPLFSLNL